MGSGKARLFSVLWRVNLITVILDPHYYIPVQIGDSCKFNFSHLTLF